MKTINKFLSESILRSFDVRQQDLSRVSHAVMKALIAANRPDPVLFRHGEALVWVETDDRGRPFFKEITQDRMRVILGRRFSWHRLNPQGLQVPAWPPLEVVRDVLAFPNVDLPRVDRIVSIPIFAPDGTIQLEAGYSEATLSIYMPSDSMKNLLDIPDEPDAEDIATVLWFFDELVCDFPFVYPGRAHTLAAMLVYFVRAMINGPTPFHLFEKPVPGTGATLLAEAVSYICLGWRVAVMTESRSEDEFARKIHSKLREGPAVIVLDNLRNRLEGATLAAALTCDVLEDRLIQASRMLAAPVRCLWIGTANNPSLSSEVARRTIPIRLDAKMTQPQLRTGFRHPNLLEWVASTHSLFVWSILTLVRAWIAAGRPKGTRVLGGYESYSEVIGGILQVAGVSGFLEIPEEQARLRDDEGDLAPLIPLWFEKYRYQPVSATDLLPLCTEVDLGDKTGQPQKIRLGQLLRANRDRQFGDVAIVAAGMRSGSNLWRLEPIPCGLQSNEPDNELIQGEGVGESGECFPPSQVEMN